MNVRGRRRLERRCRASAALHRPLLPRRIEGRTARLRQAGLIRGRRPPGAPRLHVSDRLEPVTPGALRLEGDPLQGRADGLLGDLQAGRDLLRGDIVVVRSGDALVQLPETAALAGVGSPRRTASNCAARRGTSRSDRAHGNSFGPMGWSRPAQAGAEFPMSFSAVRAPRAASWSRRLSKAMSRA